MLEFDLVDNYYVKCFQRLIDAGLDLPVAVKDTALAYLDSRPTRSGKALTRSERHAAF